MERSFVDNYKNDNYSEGAPGSSFSADKNAIARADGADSGRDC
jgi:hypothetical protein